MFRKNSEAFEKKQIKSLIPQRVVKLRFAGEMGGGVAGRQGSLMQAAGAQVYPPASHSLHNPGLDWISRNPLGAFPDPLMMPEFGSRRRLPQGVPDLSLAHQPKKLLGRAPPHSRPCLSPAASLTRKCELWREQD